MSRFLQNLTLASLIAPIAEATFRADFWEQKPMIVRRQDRDYYGDLFTVQDFDEAIARNPGYVKTADAAPTKKGTTVNPTTVTGLEAVLVDMRDGGTLVLEQLQRTEPKLGRLCRVLGQELGHTLDTVLFLTPPHGKSSVPHWDNTDGFVLQLMGSKHWRVEKERRLFPIRPHKMEEDAREFRGDVTAFTLEQGDLAYIPRGFMHMAECGSEASLHISLGIVPVVLDEFLRAAIKAAIQREERLRVALPLGFVQGGGEDIVARTAAALRGFADEKFLAAVFDQFRDELVQTHPLDTSGQVAALFRPIPLALGDVVGPRRGTMWRMQVADETVRLSVGARSVVFPALFREALEFALNTPSFAVRDVAGSLADEERIAFIERLMQEGLVVPRGEG